MRCTDKLMLSGLLVLLASCASRPLPQPAPSAPAPPVASAPPPVVSPAVGGMPAVRSWAEYRRRAARLINAANPTGVFGGPLPDPLYGIPVLQVHLNLDGSVNRIEMLRSSKISPETNQMAIEAVRRVGSFGPTGGLPGPHLFNETFLYNDDKKFQLRTLVEAL